jgi:hypothetical protein
MNNIKEYEDFFQTDVFKKMKFWKKLKIRIVFAFFSSISQF